MKPFAPLALVPGQPDWVPQVNPTCRYIQVPLIDEGQLAIAGELKGFLHANECLGPAALQLTACRWHVAILATLLHRSADVNLRETRASVSQGCEELLQQADHKAEPRGIPGTFWNSR